MLLAPSPFQRKRPWCGIPSAFRTRVAPDMAI
ncbi:Uncharacterised protein [Mycobacteroides abscessus subsp. abscessus]|nr:Uncharacterised protein [Mycobacteroides abscessus subsp. abscessus]